MKITITFYYPFITRNQWFYKQTRKSQILLFFFHCIYYSSISVTFFIPLHLLFAVVEEEYLHQYPEYHSNNWPWMSELLKQSNIRPPQLCLCNDKGHLFRHTHTRARINTHTQWNRWVHTDIRFTNVFYSRHKVTLFTTLCAYKHNYDAFTVTLTGTHSANMLHVGFVWDQLCSINLNWFVLA